MWIWLALASLAACGARPARPLVLLPAEPIVSVSTTPPAPETPLTDDDVAHDLALLLDVLELDHAGHEFVTPDTFASLRRQLGEITRRSHTARSFCDALGSELTRIIDPSIRVSLERDLATRCRGDAGTAGGIAYEGALIGRGVASSDARLHHVRVEAGEMPVTVLGIRTFMPAEDLGWEGIEESLAAALSASALVIDLRGARGADASALVPLLAVFSTDAPIAEIHSSATPRAVAMRAAASELGIGDAPETDAALAVLAQPLPPPGARPEIKRDLVVLVDASCEEACELVARVLRTHARAEVFGHVAWSHRLSTGDPGVVVLPHTGVRVAMPLRSVVVSREIARATGDRGSWFDRRGYGGGAATEHDDILPAVTSQVREQATRRARLARLQGEPVPDCATFARPTSLEALPPEVRNRIDGLYTRELTSRGGTVMVDLPAEPASLLVRTCPGLHVWSATLLGAPGLEQTMVHVTFDDPLDLARALGAEAVARIAFQEPAREHILTE